MDHRNYFGVTWTVGSQPILLDNTSQSQFFTRDQLAPLSPCNYLHIIDFHLTRHCLPFSNSLNQLRANTNGDTNSFLILFLDTNSDFWAFVNESIISVNRNTLWYDHHGMSSKPLVYYQPHRVLYVSRIQPWSSGQFVWKICKKWTEHNLFEKIQPNQPVIRTIILKISQCMLIMIDLSSIFPIYVILVPEILCCTTWYIITYIFDPNENLT